jgi:hypothetical protein
VPDFVGLHYAITHAPHAARNHPWPATLAARRLLTWDVATSPRECQSVQLPSTHTDFSVVVVHWPLTHVVEVELEIDDDDVELDTTEL